MSLSREIDRSAERDAIRGALAADMVSIARDLAPQKGRLDGHRYWACNPVRGDRHPNSFVVDVKGPTAGRWKDFATDEGGDALALIAYCVYGGTGKDAIAKAFQWARARYGWADKAPDPDLIAKRAAEWRAREEAAAKAAAKERAQKASRAKAWWLRRRDANEGKGIRGTIGEAYLREARRIDLDALAAWPNAIEFDPAMKGKDGKKHPGLLTAMTRFGGGIVAVHRTFLKKDGSGKAGIQDKKGKPADKLIFGDAYGAAMRLSKGGQSYTPETLAKRGKQLPGFRVEGLEDALTGALVWPDHIGWAAGSLSLLGPAGFQPCFESLILAADRPGSDKERDGLTRQFHQLRDAAEGRDLRMVMAKPPFKDLNDLLTALITEGEE